MIDNQMLDWDSTIENDNAFTLLPEGDYEFTVTGFTRGEFTPKRSDSKIPPCKCAELQLTIVDPATGTDVDLEDRLFLLRKFEWKLCQFFTAIGQRKRGEQLRMNWAGVPGAKGRCHVAINRFTGNDGNPRENNRITEYLEPAEAPKSKWSAGSF